MSNDSTSIKQGEDFKLEIAHTLDGNPLQGILLGKFGIYDKKSDVPLISKTLGDGLTFADGVVSIVLTELDTASLPRGVYVMECLVRDVAGTDVFILEAPLQITATKTRL